jgi:molecular chaperone DnaK (HSP70)
LAQPRFSIGIDLGTTNCAMAFEALDHATTGPELFLVPQWETAARFAEAPTLPSFLYLSSPEEAAQISAHSAESAEWIPGRFARTRAAEMPGRVIHSAKSWLCHHSVDRSAPFLPWRSDEIPVEKRISPIHASALLLAYLRAAWDAKFGGNGTPFNDQEITVTVPASFDAAAQRLTLDAAKEAGFSNNVRLLEEPQAAFYWWLDSGSQSNHALESLRQTGIRYVVVIDIGGGTTDFTLFEIVPRSGNSLSEIKRIAVSDHLLLGGDNIDLAIAHHIETRLGADEPLSEVQWNYLVARCRDVKERCLSEGSGSAFTVSVPSRSSRLLAGTLSGQIQRSEIESIILDGFFPECDRQEQPSRTRAGLREWALPYATDSAVTRYLADFLRNRPNVDAVLFNGGTLYPESLRQRLRKEIARWQNGAEPLMLENSEPSLAVAKGAARFGAIVHRHDRRIEAGAARAIYLEVHRASSESSKTAGRTLLCILPGGARSEEEFDVSQEGLELRVNRLVQFQPYYALRRENDRSGTFVEWNDREFHRLPPLQTTAKLAGSERESNRLPVTLKTRINDLGLLSVACVSADPQLPGTWPLEFDLRPHQPGGRNLEQADPVAGTAAESGLDSEQIKKAQTRIIDLFSKPLNPRDKLSATNLLKSLEQILRKPRADWNYLLIRSLWRALDESFQGRSVSVEHEESWLILAGYFLRPGFGAPGDEPRISSLWRIHAEGLKYPGKRNQLQAFILWRRVAGGLNQDRQTAILAPELARILNRTNVPAELVRLAGALERIDIVTKSDLFEEFLRAVHAAVVEKQHATPYLVALGLLLNRSPLYASRESVLPPALVDKAYDELSDFDWADPALVEIQTLFLRAGRMVDDQKIDLPKNLRDKIASKLQKAGVSPAKVARLRSYVPLAAADRANLFGESLPPGLLISFDR